MIAIDEVRLRYSTNQACLRLFLERAPMHDESGVPLFPPPPQTGTAILLFVKLFSPERQRIQ
jgi:hypothetical protein